MQIYQLCITYPLVWGSGRVPARACSPSAHLSTTATREGGIVRTLHTHTRWCHSTLSLRYYDTRERGFVTTPHTRTHSVLLLPSRCLSTTTTPEREGVTTPHTHSLHTLIHSGVNPLSKGNIIIAPYNAPPDGNTDSHKVLSACLGLLPLPGRLDTSSSRLSDDQRFDCWRPQALIFHFRISGQRNPHVDSSSVFRSKPGNK